MTKLTACIVILCCAAAISARAQIFTSLVSFDETNGANPFYGSLVQGLDGNLYGTTSTGGGTSCQNGGCGTVFSITTQGILTTLYSFCTQPNCADGVYPDSGLALAPNGNFYGTTSGGGAHNGGTVFEITSSGALTTLYSFCSQANCADGSAPLASLVLASDGFLYGTTSNGAANNNCPTGCGTVFKITAQGTFETVYSFCPQPGCFDGAAPIAALILGTDSNLYGTTYRGGTQDWGTAFKITPGGEFTVVYTFCSQFEGNECLDGNAPASALFQAENGDFYGTTNGGGPQGDGTVFRLTAGGILTTLYSFAGPTGRYPQAALFQATDRNLYGTAQSGDPRNLGTVFVLKAEGSVIRLHAFGGSDGELPASGLLQATNGTLYGTTYGGGSSNDGTVFSLSVGLSPFIETLTASGKAGTHVIILGNNLTGSTAVSFNGTTAAFAVVSDTEITATVPASATTGFVTVTTPSGTLKSNKPFRVIQ